MQIKRRMLCFYYIFFYYLFTGIEKEIEDLDSLRKYFIDDKNTSLLIAVRKLGNILEELHMEEEIQDVLSKLQVLTIDLLEDNNLQSEVDVVRNLLCFHHYCVLMVSLTSILKFIN